MTTKIIIAKHDDQEFSEFADLINDLGSMYFETSQVINEEIKKYRCPFRLSKYLDEIKGTSQFIVALDDVPSKIDYIHDLSEQSKDIADKIFLGEYSYENYIEETSHLNKYGA